MSIPGNANPLLLASAAADAAAAGPIKSVRFNPDDSSYLFKNFTSSGGSNKKFTLSFWMKLCSFDSTDEIFAASSGTTATADTLRIDSGRLQVYIANSNVLQLDSTHKLRDPSAWYHIVLQANAPTYKIYINGAVAAETSSGPNSFSGWNQTQTSIGRRQYTDSRYFDGYLADIYFVDASALEPTSFGAFDDNGVWQAAAYSGTYGTNGFHLLDFANESTVGHDSSGNENDFTANNISSQTTLSSYNLDVTSTPFQDIGTSISISNPSVSGQTAVSTTTAATNSFNLTTVADVGSANFLRSAPVTIPPVYTIDYYYRADGTQVSNARAIRSHNGSVSVFDDYGSQTSRTLRLNNQSSGNVDTTYSITDGAWNHVRITSTGVWVNGTSVQSSPPDIGGITVEYISHGGLKQSTSYQLAGEIGPVRIAPVDLGAPASGGLVANSDGTLTTLTGDNPNTDVLFDVPTNGDSSDDSGAGGEVSGNYATFNALMATTEFTYANGNLETSFDAGDNNITVSTIAPKSGKWYAEIVFTASGVANNFFGEVAVADASKIGQGFNSSTSTRYREGSADIFGAGTATGTKSDFAVGDVMGVAVDADNDTVYFYKNNTLEGTVTGLNFDGYAIGVAGNGGTNRTFTAVANYGQRSWVYSAPSGYKALCTTNLSDPTIADGSDYFDAVTYTGNGGTKTISGLEFSPDWVWFKGRSAARTHHLYDTVRGVQKPIYTNLTNAEATDTDALSSFNSDGWTMGGDSGGNANNETYVAWAWDAGSSTASNTDGSITSSVRANQTAGFSIVGYTGTGANATVGHGLNAQVEFLLVKSRDMSSSDWCVYHSGLSSTSHVLALMTTGAEENNSSTFQGTAPTNSVFSLGTRGSANGSGNDHIAYCFAPVAGYSAFGSYEGNSAKNFQYLGFQPRWIMIKTTSITAYPAYTGWAIFDTAREPNNVNVNALFANKSQQEGLRGNGSTASAPDFGIDILSNGFCLRDNGASEINLNGEDYIYAAFANNPFQANGGLAR